MSLMNSYICPKCGYHFPLFLKPSITVRRGFFSTPDLKCQKCGQLCHAEIDFRSAVIVWPIVAVYVGLMLYALRADFFRELYKKAWLLYIAFIFLFILVPLFLGFRRGRRLIKALNDQIAKTSSIRKKLSIVGAAVCIVLFGYYSKDWTNVIIGIAVGIIVYAVYNHFRQKN